MEASMDWKKLVLCFATSGALALVGCGDDDDNGNGTDVDAGPGVDATLPLDEEFEIPPPAHTCGDDLHADPEEGDTLYFVVAALDVGAFDGATGHLPGFNIDGHNTRPGETQGNTGCGQMDGEYDIDRNGVIEGPERGIDNQLADLLGAIPGDFLDLQGEVNSGSIVILAKLIGVEDLENDDCVVSELLIGSLPEGAVMELEGGKPQAGQTFEIDDLSYDEEGNALIRAQGVIENGRLIMGPVTITIAIELDPGDEEEDPTDLTLELLNASVAFTMGDGTLDDGIIGGGLNIDDLVVQVAPLIPGGLDVDVIRGIIAQLADLEPDANNDNCEAISLGLTFDAVDAVVEEEEEVVE
jgi:hypothetical protein